MTAHESGDVTTPSVPTVFGLQISSRVPLRWADRSGILDPSQRAITVEGPVLPVLGVKSSGAGYRRYW